MNEIFSLLSAGTRFKRKSNPTNNAATRATGEKQLAPKSRINIFQALEEVGDSSSKDDETEILDDADECHVGDVDDDLDAKKINSELKFQREDEVNAFRNRLQIKVSGSEIPHPVATFKQMGIFEDLETIILKNIEESAWKEPTPIQMQAIPIMLKGRDILASAPTGSGKTAAFVIPVLSKLRAPKKSGVRALLLAPTKELAEQIHREATRLCAGRRIKISLLKKPTAAAAASGQATALAGVDLLVSTPLRLLALIRANSIDLSKVEIVVLDEADKLFELEGKGHHGKDRSKKGHSEEHEADDEDDGDEKGDSEGDDEDEEEINSSSFLRQIDEILSKCSGDNLQRGLFSATIGPFVKELAASFLNNPVTLSVGVENAGANTIDQKLIFVGREDGKLLAIRQLVQQGLKPPVLIFLQSKDRAKDLFRELVFDGINVDVMHAERTQQQREEIIRRFRRGDIWVLICTDLMARGVDFKGVQMVINYDLPQSAVSYIHRIGRTGRAGRRGTAVTFFTEDDMPRLRPIANVIKLSGCKVPDWMLSLKQMKTKDRKRLRTHAPDRRNISTSPHNTEENDGKMKKRRKTDDVRNSNDNNSGKKLESVKKNKHKRRKTTN